MNNFVFNAVFLCWQEREARIESKKKMERSSIVFAFGSSTPRMLEPTDSGSTYWASRRYYFLNNLLFIFFLFYCIFFVVVSSL